MKMLRVFASLACVLSAASACAQTHGAGNAPTGSQNAAAAATVASTTPYTLHTGDTVDVNFRFTPEFNDEVVIGPDGHASLKSTGDIPLAGLTIAEAEQKIVLAASAKLVSPELTVSLKDFDRPHVVVAGEVNTPGRQDLRKATTAMQAILAAGGPKEDAAMGRVVLFRKVNSELAEVHVLKLSRYDKRTRARNDMLLEPDDMILVSHDMIENLTRYVKIANLGVYLQPLSASPVF